MPVPDQMFDKAFDRVGVPNTDLVESLWRKPVHQHGRDLIWNCRRAGKLDPMIVSAGIKLRFNSIFCYERPKLDRKTIGRWNVHRGFGPNRNHRKNTLSRPRRRTIAPDEPRLRLPIVHEATHRRSPKGPIAARHALEMHLSEQRGKMVRIMRDDDPEMQILLGSPVHQMAYLKSVHRRKM
jgi:hypothetical protein